MAWRSLRPGGAGVWDGFGRLCLGLILVLCLALAPGRTLAGAAPEVRKELSVALGAAPRETTEEKQAVPRAAAEEKPVPLAQDAAETPVRSSAPETVEQAAPPNVPPNVSQDVPQDTAKQNINPAPQQDREAIDAQTAPGRPAAVTLAAVARTAPDRAAPAQAAPTRPAAGPPAAAAAPAVPGGSGIRLFGTVEFRGVLKNMPKWERVLHAEKRSPTFDKDLSPVMRPAVYTQWKELTQRAGSMSVMEKLRSVNTFFNHWPYRLDREVYKMEDYWATPLEFMKNSGDCEDYAMTKFYALKKLGLNPESMRVVALIDKIRNIGHAILVVYADDNAYVLDNLTNLVLSHERFKQYAPQYSVNEVYRWAHVTPTRKR